MKSRTSRTLALALFLLLPSWAAAQDARQEILAADDRRLAAMVKADMTALGGLLADDLTYVHSSGQLETKAQFLDTLRTGKLRFLSAKPASRVVRLYGDTAVVNGQFDVKVKAQGKEIAMLLRFTEVWVKKGGGWKLTAWQSTRIETT
jgi:ketosteroid isomerase-like protein